MTAIGNVRKAMADAGHGPNDYRLILQACAHPLPYGNDFRLNENSGGCSRGGRSGTSVHRVGVGRDRAALQTTFDETAKAGLKPNDVTGENASWT